MGTGGTLNGARGQSSASAFAFNVLARGFDRALCHLPLWQRDFRVGGRLIRARVLGQELSALVERSFLIHCGGGPADLAVDLWDESETGVHHEDPGDPDVVGEQHGSEGERFAITADECYARYSGPGLLVRHARARSRVVGCVRAAEALSTWNRIRPLAPLIVPWLGHMGLLVVHGALVAQDGRGVLFAGPNGVGKSTIVGACLEAGFSFLGDDQVAIELEASGTISGHCIFGALKLEAGRAPGLPVPYVSCGGTEEIVAHLAGTGLLQSSTEIVALAFPALRQQPSSGAEPISRARALVELTRAHLSPRQSRLASVFEQFGVLVEKLPTFRFYVGQERPGIAEAVGSLLQG